MSSIEKTTKDGNDFFIGVIDYDDCSEVIENFNGKIENNRYIVDLTEDVLERLYQNNLINRGEKIAFENCNALAFTGA